MDVFRAETAWFSVKIKEHRQKIPTQKFGNYKIVN